MLLVYYVFIFLPYRHIIGISSFRYIQYVFSPRQNTVINDASRAAAYATILYGLVISSCGDSERDSKREVLWCYAGKCKMNGTHGGEGESFRVSLVRWRI